MKPKEYVNKYLLKGINHVDFEKDAWVGEFIEDLKKDFDTMFEATSKRSTERVRIANQLADKVDSILEATSLSEKDKTAIRSKVKQVTFLNGVEDRKESDGSLDVPLSQIKDNNLREKKIKQYYDRLRSQLSFGIHGLCNDGPVSSQMRALLKKNLADLQETIFLLEFPGDPKPNDMISAYFTEFLQTAGSDASFEKWAFTKYMLKGGN